MVPRRSSLVQPHSQSFDLFLRHSRGHTLRGRTRARGERPQNKTRSGFRLPGAGTHEGRVRKKKSPGGESRAFPDFSFDRTPLGKGRLQVLNQKTLDHSYPKSGENSKVKKLQPRMPRLNWLTQVRKKTQPGRNARRAPTRGTCAWEANLLGPCR